MLQDSVIVCNTFCLKRSLNIADIHIFLCNGSLDCKVVRMVEDYRMYEGAVTFFCKLLYICVYSGNGYDKDFLIAFGVIYLVR
jgi:hypothetical protein